MAGKVPCFTLNGPRDTGLQERQALAWCKEFDIPGDQMRQQLSWARWDLVENKKEEGVQNTINWLYGALRRTGGCYPRPDNYLSPDERRLRDLEAESKFRKAAREKIRQAGIDLEFQKILDEPEGDKYRQLLSQDPKSCFEFKGKMLETLLRKAYLETLETGAITKAIG